MNFVTTRHIANIDWLECHPRTARMFRILCKWFGHRWCHVDETTFLSYEPQIRARCSRCGYDGGLL